MLDTEKLNCWYDKVVATISSSQNKLHVDICINMIAQFGLAFPEDEKYITELKMLLDKRESEIGLLTV